MIESKWQKSNAFAFWGDVARSDHLVQIYDTDDVLLESLEGFVSSGFHSGDSVIIIATKEHLAALNNRLSRLGFALESLQSSNRYIPLDAEVTLSKFMVNGWPDEALFFNVVGSLIAQARSNNRSVRAYGEMVALLWQEGNSGATLELEQLWNRFCETETFCLFCAYPSNSFTQDVTKSVRHICSTHTKVLAGDTRSKSSTDVFYRVA